MVLSFHEKVRLNQAWKLNFIHMACGENSHQNLIINTDRWRRGEWLYYLNPDSGRWEHFRFRFSAPLYQAAPGYPCAGFNGDLDSDYHFYQCCGSVNLIYGSRSGSIPFFNIRIQIQIQAFWWHKNNFFTFFSIKGSSLFHISFDYVGIPLKEMKKMEKTSNKFEKSSKSV